MKDEYTSISHYLTHTFLFKRLGECNFLNLGVKGLTGGGLLAKYISRVTALEYEGEERRGAVQVQRGGERWLWGWGKGRVRSVLYRHWLPDFLLRHFHVNAVDLFAVRHIRALDSLPDHRALVSELFFLCLWLYRLSFRVTGDYTAGICAQNGGSNLCVWDFI